MKDSYKKYIGVKYKPHGRSIEEGLDCYGLLICILRDEGIYIPDIPSPDDDREKLREDLKASVKYIIVENPCINCIIEINVKGLPIHVGLYIGGGYFIHATEKKGVIVEPLRLYEKRVRHFYKVENCNL